ncbi:hypothetical protein PoB_000633100 [Plakobranchus ocellatus]|uniref:Uncharacterized protein n=1 Tax=Plakobranchus ocellatus TaxID=259542 RepID=A0AAV3YBS3_9GAST|nr:hypothetical protein PoB_000633100 [Plakobranchus ocellatus]
MGSDNGLAEEAWRKLRPERQPVKPEVRKWLWWLVVCQAACLFALVLSCRHSRAFHAGQTNLSSPSLLSLREDGDEVMRLRSLPVVVPGPRARLSVPGMAWLVLDSADDSNQLMKSG